MNGRILLFLAMLLPEAALSASGPILVFNEDNSVYLFDFFDNPKTNGVWKAVIAEGLEPARVAERARGVAVTDRHD